MGSAESSELIPDDYEDEHDNDNDSDNNQILKKALESVRVVFHLVSLAACRGACLYISMRAIRELSLHGIGLGAMPTDT